MALITALQFREHYPQLTGTAEDTLIDSFIARADALLAGWCGQPKNTTGVRTLASTTYSLKFDRPSLRPDVLCLCVSNLVSVEHLNLDASRAFGSGTELAVTAFDVDLVCGRIGLLPAGTAFPSAYQSIWVRFTAGYSSTPADLVVIAATEVRHLWNLRNVQGQSSYTLGGDSALLADADALIPAAVQQALAPYKACKS